MAKPLSRDLRPKFPDVPLAFYHGRRLDEFISILQRNRDLIPSDLFPDLSRQVLMPETGGDGVQRW